MEETIVIPNLRCYYCQVDHDRREEQRRAAREEMERIRGRENAYRRRAAREDPERRDRRAPGDIYEGRRVDQYRRERALRSDREELMGTRERRRAMREREDMQIPEAGPLQERDGRIRQLSQIVGDIAAMFRANAGSEADVASYVNRAEEHEEDWDSDSDGPRQDDRLTLIAINYLLIPCPPESLKEEDHTCSICLEPFGQASEGHEAEVATSLPRCYKHPCGNICLTEWLQEHDTCPVCRHDYKREIAIAMAYERAALLGRG
jgi:hypothetical protein